MRLDDLSLLLQPPPSQPVRYGQGKLLAWDAETFENEISFRGITLTDVPVLSGAEALTYQVGDTVGLLGWAPESGSLGSWWILGRLVIPGSGRGEAAVDWLTTSLGEAVARSVISETVHSDVVSAEETLSESADGDTGYTDLDTTGPEITFDTETGRWIVILFANGGIPGDSAAARMGYTASGAQSLSATNDRATLLGSSREIGTAGFGNHVLARTHDGSSGEITVTAKYRFIAGDVPGGASFENRFMLVIAY
ncbi:MAG: hypothetical protein ACODAF_05785 [Actinomycetota bacterium]